jgi:hypothetical protein
MKRDSDEFLACERLAQQKTPIDVAVSALIDFYSMAEEKARSYLREALQKHKSRE